MGAADGSRIPFMDWSNPVTYGVILTAAIAFGGVLWRIFWWVAKIDPLPTMFHDLATEIRSDIKKILLRLPPTPAPVASDSPLSLTEFGHRMARLMDASTWAAGIAPPLFESERLSGREEFEIDAFSRRYVRENMPEDPRVSKCMYELGVDRDNALRVLHVVLRDELIRLSRQGR